MGNRVVAQHYYKKATADNSETLPSARRPATDEQIAMAAHFAVLGIRTLLYMALFNISYNPIIGPTPEVNVLEASHTANSARTRRRTCRPSSGNSTGPHPSSARSSQDAEAPGATRSRTSVR